MASGVSVVVSFFTISDAIAIDKVLASAISAPTEISVKPGCSMINVPKNPTAMAAIRRARMISPRNSTAPMVTNKGPVKLSAVICASGINVRAVKPQNIPPKLITARRKNNFGFCMRMLDQPTRMISGINRTTASALRKNTTSMTGKSAADSRMKIPMQVNMNSATIIKIVARICGGKF